MMSTASVGITSTTFVNMLRISSTTPPRYPATNPTVMPMIDAITAASAPTTKLERSP